MGKQGPCYHCGVTSTPLWRNGPPEKPVLCNACGSRWRTKGSLVNYTPLHARADIVDSEDYKTFRAKNVITKKETKSNKRKNLEVHVESNGEASHCDQNFKQFLEEEASNRSSSDSAVSYSESYAHLGSVDGSDWAASAQSVVWDSLVPSRKRTCVSRSKPSSVEKLTKDLCSILHEQQQSSHFSASSEEDLLLESGSPLDSFEIGHGGCLVKFINSSCREEESEASSLTVYSKNQIMTKAHVGPQPNLSSKCKEINIPGIGDGKIKKFNSDGAQESSTRRDKLSEEKLAVLSRTSPLASVDLRVVVNFEEFMRHMNCEEQQLLMKYLPAADTTNLPDSLKSMFDSPQFLESLLSFQQLLREGIFDIPCTGIINSKYRTLRRLVLSSLSKSKWIEHYQQHKEVKPKNTTVHREQIVGPSLLGYGSSTPHQTTKDEQNWNITEPQPNSTCKNLKFTNTGKEGSYVNSRNLLTLSKDGKSSILGLFQHSDVISDQDLLFDVPSNASFPEAELLSCHSSKSKAQACKSDGIPSNESSSTLLSQISSIGVTCPYPVLQ